MELISVSDNYYIFNEFYYNFYLFSINLKDIYSNFERTQPILWKEAVSSLPILRL
jgi:hypothetical protein